MLDFNLSLSDTADEGKIYDLIIIGGGPAGLTAGLYAARYKLETLMIEKSPVSGGQLANTEWVENYPGFPEPVLGKKLAKDMESQARLFGLKIINMEVQSVDLTGEIKTVTGGFQTLSARSILIATGSSPRKLGIPSEEEFAGRGISYCATCDGPFYPDKTLAVVGGGNTALEESLFLAKYAAQIHIVHRREEFSADPIILDRVKANPKIQLITNSVVDEIRFGQEPRTLVLKDTISGKKRKLEADGIFIFIGAIPNTGLFAGQLELEDGYIVTDRSHATSVEGVWAAGDVQAGALRQVATAVGDGALAAHRIHKYLSDKEG